MNGPSSRRHHVIILHCPVSCMGSPPKHTSNHRSFKFYTCVYLCSLVLACQNVGHSNLYFLNGSHLVISRMCFSVYMITLRAFIFKHQYWGWAQRKNKSTMVNIFEIMIMLNFHILHLLDSHTCAMRYIYSDFIGYGCSCHIYLHRCQTSSGLHGHILLT